MYTCIDCLKEQYNEIFYLWFFIKRPLLVPVDKPRDNFDFFRLFAEIFDYFGASPVSMTPVCDAVAVLDCFTSVNDIAEEFLTSPPGIVDTSQY